MSKKANAESPVSWSTDQETSFHEATDTQHRKIDEPQHTRKTTQERKTHTRYDRPPRLWNRIYRILVKIAQKARDISVLVYMVWKDARQMHPMVKPFIWFGKTTVMRICGIIRPTTAYLHCSGGVEDPYETARISVLVTGAAAHLHSRFPYRVSFTPRFDHGQEWHVEGACTCRFCLGQLFLFGGLTVISFPYLATYRLWRYVGRKKQKEDI
ncbi:hypothetical protein [Chitinivibrio alkaliphilus]|uniref:Uncharacterized protein n=1 Tax=Chitinivibrio alkaliphilus ACht1 TaxID=1313304 RepID=U7D8P1_9BACT|nr:hypothetical protein [Chitinivibrio alkaliphilus]ERP39290.1 hypothetical protein CALK_0082 [Chitinivibrio alkaliphilus ACht1]